jgi:hypothetical protein
MIGDPGQHGAKVKFRVEAVWFCRSNESVYGRGPLTAAARSDKQEDDMTAMWSWRRQWLS